MFMFLISKCCLSSSGKPKGKKGGGKDKPKNVKSNTGGEQVPEVCTVYSISFDIFIPFSYQKEPCDIVLLSENVPYSYFLVSSLHFHFQRELIPRCLTYNNDTSLIVAEEPERVGLSRDTKNSPLRSLWGGNKNSKKAFWKQTLMDWISWRRAEIYIYFFNYSIMLSETAVCVWEAVCTDWNLFCTFFGNFSLYW